MKKRAVLRQPAFKLVGVQGFEPWTPRSQTRCATGLRYTPKNRIIPAHIILVNMFKQTFIKICYRSSDKINCGLLKMALKQLPFPGSDASTK